MTSRDVVLAVDSSTTGTKVLAFAADGTRCASARGRHDRSSPRPGWQEQDPRQWWARLVATLTEVSGQLRADGHRPVALCVTHQRETFVLLDGDGEPVRPAVLWLDTRASEEIERLGAPWVHERSGKPPSTTPSLYKLAWLAEHEPDVMRRASTVVDAHGFLVQRLTGEATTSWASADPLSLLDMTTFSWDDDLLRLAGLDRSHTQSLAAPGSVISGLSDSVARLTGLPADLPVVAGCGDGQAAGLGAGALRPGLAYLNLGTAFTLGTHADEYSTSRAYRTLGSPLAGGYTLEALVSSGALSLSWLAENVAGVSSPADLEDEAAAIAPGAGGLLFMPYLTSAETPHWDAETRGAFVGLSDQHGRGHLYRSVVEGLAMEEALSLAAIEAATGDAVSTVHLLGGAAASPLVTDILASVLDVEVLVCEETEATALGAGALAAGAVALDGVAGPAEAAAAMTRLTPVRGPDSDSVARYGELLTVYADMYPALKALQHRLKPFRDS